MKNVSISLTDQHAAEIDAHIASGDYASVSEVIRAALRGFLYPVQTPGLAQIAREIELCRAAILRTDRGPSAPEAKPDGDADDTASPCE
jgi:putative addiction module CopG family antidote